MVALKKVTLPAYKTRKARKVENTNELLGEYRGMLGGKTGYTGDAKYGVVTTAERNGIALTAVVLGAPNNKARFADSKRLLNWGFKRLRRQTVATATETVSAVPLVADPNRTVQARFAETTSALMLDIDRSGQARALAPAAGGVARLRGARARPDRADAGRAVRSQRRGGSSHRRGIGRGDRGVGTGLRLRRTLGRGPRCGRIRLGRALRPGGAELSARSVCAKRCPRP